MAAVALIYFDLSEHKIMHLGTEFKLNFALKLSPANQSDV